MDMVSNELYFLISNWALNYPGNMRIFEWIRYLEDLVLVDLYPLQPGEILTHKALAILLYLVSLAESPMLGMVSISIGLFFQAYPCWEKGLVS